MDREYYQPVSPEKYEKFVATYKAKVLSRLKDRKNVVKEIKHLGAGLMVNKLKDPNDIFSSFIPPREAKEFKEKALGYSQGIGIEGALIDTGYLIDRVELRSDSYKKGIRPGDIIISVGGRNIIGLSEEEFKTAMFPPLGAVVSLEILFRDTQEITQVDVKVIEFFNETLSSVPTGIPGMFYVKINQFNKKTGEDMKLLLSYFMRQNMNKLVIDLRGNAGGPPLAAREIASMFLKPNVDLFYFQRKNRPRAILKTFYSNIRYTGRIAILIDKGSGSASELFAGTLRERERAIIIGSERSAGKTLLKSMFHFEDKSMLLLVTSLAYLYNGDTYDTKGIEPDFLVTENVNLFALVSKCIDTYYEK